ncbi:hypothetical protein [Moorella sp. ACPs]|uniref:hypothetical protein n=1 Tax=Neomoorella carbonis TaxID=3062783 RepID=UPI003873763B
MAEKRPGLLPAPINFSSEHPPGKLEQNYSEYKSFQLQPPNIRAKISEVVDAYADHLAY